MFKTHIDYKDRRFTIVFDDKGIYAIDSRSDVIEAAFPNIHTNDLLGEPYRNALNAYLLGERTSFDFPLFPSGTEFQKKVWNELLNVPYGETVSYSDIAHRIGDVKKVRAVANAIGKNPIMIMIPCHRVIGKDGSLHGYAGGLPLKKQLLHLESEGQF